MATLRDYQLNLYTIDSEDNIFYSKFEEYFYKVHNGTSIINFNIFGEDTKDNLISLFNNTSKDHKVKVFSVNPDTDIPCMKKEYFRFGELPYDELLQTKIDFQDPLTFIDDFVDSNIPENLNLYCHSVIKSNPNLHIIPLGRDFKGREVIEKTKFDLSGNRNILCYYNCSIPEKTLHWYGRIRDRIYQSSLNKDFIVKGNIDTVKHRNFGEDSFIKYYGKIASSKFMICPRGCGIDTYRMWECLYLGCVPIVVNYGGFKDFSDLPILFIDEWQDYLNIDSEYLENKYSEMLDKNYNYDKLKFSWWKEYLMLS
jgi:hypothetical protein